MSTTVKRADANGHCWVIIDGKAAGFVQKTPENEWEAWLHVTQPSRSGGAQPHHNRRIGYPQPSKRDAVDEIEIKFATENWNR
jgi:hypothetical protein